MGDRENLNHMISERKCHWPKSLRGQRLCPGFMGGEREENRTSHSNMVSFLSHSGYPASLSHRLPMSPSEPRGSVEVGVGVHGLGKERGKRVRDHGLPEVCVCG